ncbi:MAG: DUF5916 domain-containing protein [Bacteroidota bacterium]
MPALALLAALALLSMPTAAQSPSAANSARPSAPSPTHVLHATRASDIDIDGRLDEAAWATAEAASDFVQFAPQAGVAASEQTTARVLVGRTTLYVGLRLDDSQPSGIDDRLARRDTPPATDAASVMLDSYDDDRTAFVFQVTAAGVQRDALLFDDIREDASWDAVWDVATRRDDAGWTAEFAIPLAQLRFAGGEGPHTWGVQFRRTHFRTGEVAYWAPQLPSTFGIVSRFGALTIPGALRAPRAVEVQPYVASALTRAPGDAADPFYQASDLAPNVGVDFKVGLTSDLRLTGTVNPDFGQVEADPAQINLTAYELFFPEQRPFFIEGLEVFNYGRTRSYFNNNRPLFLYTRRIGRGPQRTAFVPGAAYDAAGEAGTVYTDAPAQTTILGAAKMTGRIGPFTVGVLDAVTAPEYGRFAVRGGTEAMDDRAQIEPASNYLVARGRGRFGAAQVGGLLTAVNRNTNDDALATLLPSHEYVVGVDAEYALSDAWIVSGLGAASHVGGSADAMLGLQTAFRRLYQRPDADHLAVDSSRTTLVGTTAEVAIAKVSGTHWRGSLSAAYTSPGFESNALGFQTRADQNYVGLSVFYDEPEAQGWLRRWTANVFGSLGYSMGWDRTHSFMGWGLGMEFASLWSARLSGFANLRTVNDRITRGGPLWTDPLGAQASLTVTSDPRKAVGGTGYVHGGGDETGGGFYGGSVTMNARPAPGIVVSLGPDVTRTVSPYQYVTAFDEPAAAATFGRRYVFGRIDRLDLALVSRLDWTFLPTVSLQLYLRPLVSTGRYTDFRAFTEPGVMDLPVYGIDLGALRDNPDGSVTIDPGDGGATFEIADRDFTFRALQGNAVLRWEYRPGSTLFAVWQQQRSDTLVQDGRLRGRDLSALFTDPGTNVFLVKLSYWLAR